MAPYFIILILIFVCAIIDNKSKKNNVKIFIFVVLALFAGLRYGVGIDYFSYITIFNASEGEFIREPGRAFLIESIKAIGGKDQFYILFMAMFTEFFAYKTLIKYERKDFWFLTIVFYGISLFYIASFNASRQYMAISLILWSFQFVEKKTWLFIVISLIAGVGIHYSALMFIPLSFFIKKTHKKWIVLSFIPFLFIINEIAIKFISLTPYEKYEELLSNDFRENQVQITQYLLMAISLFLIVFGDRFKNFRNNTVLVNLNILCLYTLFLVIIQDVPSFIMLFQRFNNYFVYSYLLIIPSILSSFSKNEENISKLILIIFSIGYLILTIVVKGQKHVLVPYDINLNLF